MLWLVVLLAVLARQILLIVDNDRLRRNLERLVEERTRLLNQVSQQAELMLTSVGDGIYGVDRIGMVTFVNPAAAHSLGFRPEDLIGREAHATFHDTQPDGTPFPVQSCYVTEAIQASRTTSAEEDNYRRADGLSIPVEVTATPLLDEAGGAIGAVVVFRDVTQRREVDRMKSEFVSMVSHELRTPLTAIRGSMGLLAGGALGELSPSASRMVDIALVSIERLSRLINEILDIERIESGLLPMELAPHEARTLIEAAVGQVQVIAEDAGVHVNIGRTEGQVHADADRVVQTLHQPVEQRDQVLPPRWLRLGPLGNSGRLRRVRHPRRRSRHPGRRPGPDLLPLPPGRLLRRPGEGWVRARPVHQPQHRGTAGRPDLGTEQRRGGRNLPVHPADPRTGRWSASRARRCER